MDENEVRSRVVSYLAKWYETRWCIPYDGVSNDVDTRYEKSGRPPVVMRWTRLVVGEYSEEVRRTPNFAYPPSASDLRLD